MVVLSQALDHISRVPDLAVCAGLTAQHVDEEHGSDRNGAP